MHPVDIMAKSFEDELRKIAGAKEQAAKSLLLPGALLGAGGAVVVGRAHKDWKNGRQMRLQNQGY